MASSQVSDVTADNKMNFVQILFLVFRLRPQHNTSDG